MNLYFRLLYIFGFELRRLRRVIGFLETSRYSFRALPSDCDINLHVTNSRYLAFMDLARTWMLAEMKLLKPVLNKRWFPIVNANAITYVKDIKPWQNLLLKHDY